MCKGPGVGMEVGANEELRRRWIECGGRERGRRWGRRSRERTCLKNTEMTFFFFLFGLH